MIDTRLRKIFRDLSERKGRTLLTLLGLVIGLWGFASVAVAWLVLSNDLSENFLSTNPPGIAMTIAGDGPLDVEALGPIEGASAIENRPQLSARMEISPDRWLPIQLWVVEDFGAMNVARIFPEKGTLPPATGMLAVERDGVNLVNFFRMKEQSGTVGHQAVPVDAAKKITRLEEGDVTIRLAGGKIITARVSASVFDPAQAPSRMEQALYGYLTRETAEAWTEGVVPDRLLVRPAQDYLDEQAIRETAGRLEARLAELGFQVVKTRYPSPTEHVHQFQMNSILFLLTGLGVLALMMSAVLVLNLINGILTNQIRQIGVLKAIGASTGKVAMIYLGAMALIGLLATLVALPLAIKSGYFVAGGISAFLNFKILTTELPIAMVGGLFFLGVIFPVLAAISPVRHWAGVSVTSALQHFGINPAQQQGAFWEKLPIPLSINFRMGVRNAFRKPLRLVLTAATLGIGLLIFLIAMNMRSSLIHTAEMEETQKRFDIAASFEKPTDVKYLSWMELFPIVERAETWKIEAAIIVDKEGREDPPRALYLVPEGSQVLNPFMLEGVWLDEGRSGGIVINQRLQFAYPGLVVGDSLSVLLRGEIRELPVIGVMKEFGGSALYMRDEDYRVLFPEADRSAKLNEINNLQPFSVFWKTSSEDLSAYKNIKKREKVLSDF